MGKVRGGYPHHPAEPAAAVRVLHLHDRKTGDGLKQVTYGPRQSLTSAKVAWVMDRYAFAYRVEFDPCDPARKKIMDVLHNRDFRAGLKQFRVILFKRQAARRAGSNDRGHLKRFEERGIVRGKLFRRLPVAERKKRPAAALQVGEHDHVVSDRVQDAYSRASNVRLNIFNRTPREKSNPA